MKSIDLQRQSGSYYTPQQVSQLLCDWAIQSKDDLILEPGFGGCGFLEASKRRLEDLGCKTANIQIFGCDNDKQAFEHLSDKIGPTSLDKRFIFSDYLNLNPEDFSKSSFDAIVGNPPYVSMHNMTPDQLKTARKMKFEGIEIGGRASLWAYFLIHSLSFIKPGGRCAWVLPSSFMHTDYAKTVRQHLETNFEKLLIVPIRERLFRSVGAKESTNILLADGWGKRRDIPATQIHYVNNKEELSDSISDWSGKNNTKFNSPTNNTLLKERTLSQKSFHLLSNHTQCQKFEELAVIRIGIVTGANKYFVMNTEHAQKAKLPDSVLKPIFARTNQTKGVSITVKTLQKNRIDNFRCLLLDTSGRKLSLKSVQSYLDSFPHDDIDRIKTFKKRAVWHRPDDLNTPDGFLTYMSHNRSRLVLNSADTTSTNSIHRIYFRTPTTNSERKLIAISFLTTFSQLSTEIEGRSYGSGVLKLEPSDARKVAIILPQGFSTKEANEAFRKIDRLLIEGLMDEARKYADRIVLKPLLGQHSKKYIAALNDSLLLLRAIRKGS